MKLIEFNKKHLAEYGIVGTGIRTQTSKEKVWRNKQTGEVTFTIPAESWVHVDFSPKQFPGTIFITFNDEVKTSATVRGSSWLKGIRKPPTLKTLEKRQWDGISKSVTGARVEPDGYGVDGSPSWELVIGVI